MDIQINEINFPDETFRSYVQNNIAGGSSVLYDYMRVSSININDLGIHDITGIEYLISPDSYSFLINLNNNHIPYYDFDALQTSVLVTPNQQTIKLPANEIMMTNDLEYPYQVDLKKYVPSDKVINITFGGTGSDGFLLARYDNNNCYGFEGGILKTKFDIRSISYKTNELNVYMVRDPAFKGFLYNIYKDKIAFNRNASVSLKARVYEDESYPFLNTTLPAVWSIVKGALPPGLTLNTNTGELSGVIS